METPEKPEKVKRTRTVAPSEERIKRGRWVLPVALILSLLGSLWFWSR